MNILKLKLKFKMHLNTNKYQINFRKPEISVLLNILTVRLVLQRLNQFSMALKIQVRKSWICLLFMICPIETALLDLPMVKFIMRTIAVH